MRAMALFTAIFALALLSPSARAEPPEDAYLLNFSDSGQRIPIGVMPKAECVATIEAAFNPEETIVAGLNALGAAKSQSAMQSCLTELVTSLSPEMSYGAFENSASAMKQGKADIYFAELRQKKICHNPHQTGDHAYDSYQSVYGKTCEGKWLSEEESKKAEAELAEISRFLALIQALPQTLVDRHAEEREQINELDDKIDSCGPNPYPSNDTYYYKNYAKNQAKNCKHVYSENEIKAMKKKLAELREKYQKEYAESSQQQQRLQDALYSGSYVADDIFDRRKELVPLARAVACISPYESGSSHEKYWKSEQKENGYCEEKFGKKSDLPKARAKFLAALGDLDKLAAKNKAALEEATKQQNLKLLALAANRTKRYVYRRLFANYKGYLDRTSTGGSVADFCATFEAEGRRDVRFSRIYGEGTGAIYAFRDSKQWLHAQYGLTEAEYKALSMYVGNFYHKINEPLWKHETLSPELALYKDVLDSALKKLPTLAGGIPLSRQITLPQASIDAHKLNEIITYDSYTSTSKAQTWIWSGNAKMIIYGGKNSKDVSNYNVGEQEVIFLPGTRFRVIGKETVDGTTNFVLGEVDDNGDLVARLPVPKGYAP